MPAAATIQVRCACGRKLTAPAGSEGKKARCPSCGAKMVIGSQPQASAAKAPAAVNRSSSNAASTGSSSSIPRQATAIAATATVAAPDAPTPEENDDQLQSLYDIADEIEQTAPVEEVPRCPQCRSPMSGGAVFCVKCGYDSRTGERASNATLEQPSSSLPSRRGTMNGQKPSLVQKLVAQWPGLVGFLLLGMGLFWVWYVRTYGGYISFKMVGLIFGLGVASLGYWSMANRNDNFNF